MAGFIFFPCAYKQLFGFSCPMCGFQRAVLLMCDGKIWDGICRFPPMVAFVVALLFFALRMIVGQRTQMWPDKWVWAFLLLSLLFNWVYQNAIE